MKSDIRLEELIEITIELMILNSIKSLDDQKISRKDQKNIWNQICYLYVFIFIFISNIIFQ